MKRFIILLALLVALLIINTGSVVAAPGSCLCREDAGYWDIWTDDCNSPCYAAECTGSGFPSCECIPMSDLDSATCTNPDCPYNPNVYGFNYFFTVSQYNAGDANKESQCCGNEAGENYVYSIGWRGCCNNAYDCPTGAYTCKPDGSLYSSDRYFCREGLDDWRDCGNSANQNKMFTEASQTYCCLNTGSWKWVGPNCDNCDYSEQVCTDIDVCGGDWAEDYYLGDGIDDSSCCLGSLVYQTEKIGGSGCGTLDSTCAPDCICIDPPLF